MWSPAELNQHQSICTFTFTVFLLLKYKVICTLPPEWIYFAIRVKCKHNKKENSKRSSRNVLTVLQYCYKCQKLGCMEACSCHWKNLFSTSVSHNFRLRLEFKVFLLSVYNFLSVSCFESEPNLNRNTNLDNLKIWLTDGKKGGNTRLFFVDIVVLLSCTNVKITVTT